MASGMINQGCCCWELVDLSGVDWVRGGGRGGGVGEGVWEGVGEGGRGPARRERDLERSSSACVMWVRVEVGVKEEEGGLGPRNMPARTESCHGPVGTNDVPSSLTKCVVEGHVVATHPPVVGRLVVEMTLRGSWRRSEGGQWHSPQHHSPEWRS